MSYAEPVAESPAGSSAVLDALAARAAVQASAENFPVALRLLPRKVRDDLTRVYAFARFVDDVGDEATGNRTALLRAVDDQLRRLYSGRRVTLAPVADLAQVIAAGVLVQPFYDLVTANMRDQTQHRYETFADLLDYCRFSAHPVGRIVLQRAGVATEENVADSDRVCAGLQVLEHCQDVGEDARANRVYLPGVDLRAAGVAEDELTSTATSPALRHVVAAQVTRAEDLLESGTDLVARLRGWARLAVAGYVAGGLATAEALRASGFDVLGTDVRPGKRATAAHALRLLAGVVR